MIVGILAAIFLAGSGPAPATPGDETFENAEDLHRFSFEAADDEDYDRQPDGWSRRRGPGFPQYVRAQIDRDMAAHGSQSLLVELNGAPFAYYSPLVGVDGQHAYVLRARIRSAGLSNDAALVSVSLLDSTRKRVERLLSRPVTGRHDRWATVEIGPFRPGQDVHSLVVGCHIAQGETTDVRGQVWFDDLWLRSMPLLELSPTAGSHFLQPGEKIHVEARPLGLARGRPHRLRLKLENDNGDVLEQSDFDLHPDEAPAAQEDTRAPIAWSLTARPNGFYRVRAVVERDGAPLLAKETSFVVMDPVPAVGTGEFGWSVANGAGTLPLVDLAEIASRSGVNWLKLPLWSSGSTEEKSDDSTSRMGLFLDRLDQQGMALVGMLSDPPPQLADKYARRWGGISNIFSMPRDFWSPSLAPLIARHSFRIRHWQLGSENDDSFVGLTTLPQILATVKQEFDRIGHDACIGVHWKWDQPFPVLPSAGHSFLSLGGQPLPEAADLRENLDRTRASALPRWVLVAPPARSDMPAPERAGELARQILAAKLGRAEAIFAADPFDGERGLLNVDGSPTDNYLPWRTLALALRGASYLGQFEMPQRSANAVFDCGNEIVAVIWNAQSVREEFYFGEQPVAVDLWGRRQKMPLDPRTRTQSLEVGPIPLIVRNCASFVSRWRMAARFDKGMISSEFGQHEDALLIANASPQGISGKAIFHFPPGWEIDPPLRTFQAAAGEKLTLPFLVKFPPDASLGDLRPAIDFEIAAERMYKFTMFIPYRLGLGDVDLQVATRWTADGRLEVEQHITNSTEPPEVLEFNCSLFIPGQIRQRHFVTRLGKGEDRRFYVVPAAEKLRGKELWLRAEQINGRRVLNFHFKVEE
jgi:hypothetical protein